MTHQRKARGKARNPVARALRRSGSLRPKVVKAVLGKGSYTRKGRARSRRGDRSDDPV